MKPKMITLLLYGYLKKTPVDPAVSLSAAQIPYRIDMAKPH